MIKRVLAGFSVTDGTLALDVIREVGHGGDFLMHDHTLSHFKKELFFPALFRRQTTDQWLERGAKPMAGISHERVRDILAEVDPIPLPEGADQELGRILRQADLEPD